MAKLEATLAIDRYDYLRPLLLGEVVPEGVDLRIIEVPAGIRHERMYRYEEYDVCEFALGGHIVAASRGELLGQAVPVFPRRMFPHKFMTVRVDRRIESPRDLEGKKMGIASYENSLQIPVRAALEHQYGLPREAIRWMARGRGLVGIDQVAGVNLETIKEGRDLEEMLLGGDLDAIVFPSIVNSLVQGDSRVRSLFNDPKTEEKNFYRSTGLFPIMHDLLLKRSILDRDPWVANSLLEAFRKARRRHLLWMEQPPNLSLAWGRELLLEERSLFGPKQFDDGFRENRTQLDLMCRYAHEQGMTGNPVDPAVLFVPSTLES